MELTKPVLNNRLVIWPEAGVPQIEPLAQGYLINLDMQASEHQSAVVTDRLVLGNAFFELKVCVLEGCVDFGNDVQDEFAQLLVEVGKGYFAFRVVDGPQNVDLVQASVQNFFRLVAGTALEVQGLRKKQAVDQSVQGM